MNIHEFQAKALFRDYGIPVPEGHVVRSVDGALQTAKDLGAPPWVIKAQVHAGGRGKAGGVKIVASLSELEQAAETLLGQRLVTAQTGAAC